MSDDEPITPGMSPIMIDMRFIERFASAELSECAVALANSASIGRQDPQYARPAELLDAVAQMLLEIVVARDDFHRVMGR